MKLLSFFIKVSWANILLSSVVSVASGASSASLLAVVGSRLGDHESTGYRYAESFAALVVCMLLTGFLSRIVSIKFSQKTSHALRMRLCRKILNADLCKIEELGTPRFMAALTEDVPAVTSALMQIPQLCVNLAIVVGCVVYLGYLSKELLGGLILVLVVLTLSYVLPEKGARRFIKLGREEWGQLLKHFRALMEGSKELKLHQRRRRTFFQEIIQTTAVTFQRYHLSAAYRYAAISTWNQGMYFVAIGLLLFLLPQVGLISTKSLPGYALTLLYMQGPIGALLGIYPTFTRASVSLSKIEELGLSLLTPDTPEDLKLGQDHQTPPWSSLELLGVEHVYYREQEDETFTLGPINLSFRPGELVLIVGGNGSGKTTFAKILTGLYTPRSGEIRIDGVPVDDLNRDAYRQYFSAVFSDFYLFDKLIGADCQNLDELATDYLSKLHLQHKVKVKGAELSTTALSQGQRKRLALLTAYLEDRAIYVFDEWAADQDPLFKDVFYYELLPELKASGKTAIVITHDDRYFSVADRIIKINYGRIEYDTHNIQDEVADLAAESSVVAASDAGKS